MNRTKYFICPICGNKEEKFVGYRKEKPYCRKCITFRGQEVTNNYVPNDNADYALHYELSNDQKRLSKQLLNNYISGLNTLVKAVCGAGKTEISIEVIKYAIEHHQKVGFAIPRKDVVRELYFRFKSFFPNNKIVSVYGGNTRRLQGDLICLTTHQLFRYEKYFDLLIVDEIDAFPYNGNDVLEAFLKRSIKGKLIMMSATPSEEVLKKFSSRGHRIVTLDTRFHLQPLPVPTAIIQKGLMKYYCLARELRRFLNENKSVFVFTPTIDICEQTYNVLKILFKNISFVHSKCTDRSERIESFRNGDIQTLVTTSVLERGVTVKNLQVIVFKADHPLYTSQALIQISGRVGRKKDAPYGEVIFIGDKQTNEMVECINEIKRANKAL